MVDLLSERKILPSKYRDHELIGKWSGIRECHIQSDWLLAYQFTKDELILYLVDTGSHASMLVCKC